MDTNFREALTSKQQLFCDEYLMDLNATRAALRAGYSSSTALNGQLMVMPKIKYYLQQRMAANATKAQFTHDMVLRELGKIAFGNMAAYFDEAGNIKPMHNVSDDAKAALWSVSVSDAGSGASAGVGTTKFRMYNKLAALDKIAKHTGFYNVDATAPPVVYSCLTHDEMTADDSFDDAVLQEELRLKKMQEARIRNQDARAKKKQEIKTQKQEEDSDQLAAGDTTNETDSYDPDAVPLDEYGNVLCDGAGIPYGKLPPVVSAVERVPDPNNFLDLNEKPEDLLKRLGLAAPPKVTEVRRGALLWRTYVD